jgi:ABC-type multidrug transport system ATPase subunit
MITLEAVAAQVPPLALASLSLTWDAGTHAVVGSRTDGGSLLLQLLAGRARPRAGRLTVLGGLPTDAAVRRQVAWVPLEPALPEAMRVRGALAVAAAVRKEPPGDAVKRLAILGIEALAERRVWTLSRDEARAVALAEALTSARVRVLLVEEPLLAMDPRATGRVAEALGARARDRCAVVITTGSLRDASDIAEDFVALRAGAIVARKRCSDRLVEPELGGARLRVVLQDARDVGALVAALADAGDVEAIERSEGLVRLWGADGAALARAAGRAALAADVDVAELRLDPAPAPPERGP